jgi:hypothetical protein
MYLKTCLFFYLKKNKDFLFFSSHNINFIGVFNDFLHTNIKNILF